MAIDAHFDACDIVTKGGGKAQIGICGFIREKINGWVKRKSD